MKVYCSYTILATFDDLPDDISPNEIAEIGHDWATDHGFDNLVNDFEWEVAKDD